MAYDAKKDINEIAWLKQVYTNGNDSDKKWAAAEAGKYYDNLRNNGYGHIADNLKGYDAGQAYNFSKGYVNEYNGQEYADNYKKNANNAYDKQLDAIKANYAGQKDSINLNYDDAVKSARASYLQTQKLLPQQLAAQGISGGASESAHLKLSNNYMNNVYNLEKQRADALKSIDDAIMSATYNTEAQKANAENTYAQMAYDISRDTRDYFANQRNINADRNINYEQYEFNKALSFASAGNFDSLARYMNVTPQEAEQAYRRWIMFNNDPNGLSAMQTYYNINKPYYKNTSQGSYGADDGGYTPEDEIRFMDIN